MNWVVIFAMGQITVDILPLDWHLDGLGMAVVAGRLEGRLRDLLGANVRLPRVVMSDRGTGMYASNASGHPVFMCVMSLCSFGLVRLLVCWCVCLRAGVGGWWLVAAVAAVHGLSVVLTLSVLLLMSVMLRGGLLGSFWCPCLCALAVVDLSLGCRKWFC